MESQGLFVGIHELLRRKAALEAEMLEVNKLIRMAANITAQETFKPYMVQIAESGTRLAEAFAGTHVENYEEAIRTAVAEVGEAWNKAATYLSAWKLPETPVEMLAKFEVAPSPCAIPPPPLTEEMFQKVSEEAIAEAGIDPVYLLPCDDRLKKIILAAKDTHPRIATKLTEGIEKVAVDEAACTICLGNIAFNGGERTWLIKSVKDAFGENFGLK